LAPFRKYGSEEYAGSLNGREDMEAPRPIIASVRSAAQRLKSARRKIRLELFELEPESGEDEAVPLDLGLDQLEE